MYYSSMLYEEMQDAYEKVSMLESVSGHDIDSLISLFAAGYTLKAPSPIDGLCLSPILKEKED